MNNIDSLPLTNKDDWNETSFCGQYEIFIENDYHEMFTIGITSTAHTLHKPINNNVSYLLEGIQIIFNHTFNI